ncbi:MAG: hypothetical protein ABEI99_08640, partial [Halobaculum sp.]
MNFHNTDIAVLQLAGPSGFVLTLELVDSDRDERLTVVLDLDAVARGDLAGGVTVEGGEPADRRVENASGTFPAGTYNLTLSTPNGVGGASATANDPTTDASPPAIAGLSFSTLRPGTGQNVSVTML